MKIHNLTLQDIEELATEANRSGVSSVQMTVSEEIFTKLPDGGREDIGMVVYEFKTKIKFIKDDTTN
jgi:hypothetical protein